MTEHTGENCAPEAFIPLEGGQRMPLPGNTLPIYLQEGACPPVTGYQNDLGLDLCSPEDIHIEPGGSYAVDLLLSVYIPELPAPMSDMFHVGGLVWPKSGHTFRASMETGGGVIDPGYTDNIKVKLYNHGKDPIDFKRGAKVAQLILMLCMKVGKVQVMDEPLDRAAERGKRGFGSQGTY